MKRRQFIMAVGLLGFDLCGCETSRQARMAQRGDSVDEPDDEAHAVGVRARPPKGFFKGSRLPGGLSPEAREIENDFGIQ